MERVIETRIVWSPPDRVSLLNYGTKHGDVRITSAETQIWSSHPALSIRLGFQGFIPEEADPWAWLEILKVDLDGTQITPRFGGWRPPSGDQTVVFEFPRVRREDICMTVFKTYLLILKRLGVAKLDGICLIAPTITQETYWRDAGERGKWRYTWVPHGEYLARQMVAP